MSSSLPLFQRLVSDIVVCQTTPTRAAETLYNELTKEERLGLLDGDLDLLGFITSTLKQGYCFRPFVAASVPRLGIPGIRFSDGPRGVALQGRGTAFPATSTRAQTWNPVLEEQVVSPSASLTSGI